MLLLLRPLDGTKHSYVKASQHCCVHVCKGTISSFVAFEANSLALQHLEDGLQIILLCTLWPRSAHYVSMEHAAAAVQVIGLAD